VSLPHDVLLYTRKVSNVQKELAFAFLVSACGGESFSSELFVDPVEAGQEAGPVEVDAGVAPIEADAPACASRTYLRLDGGRAALSGGPLRPPITVSYELRLTGLDPAVRVARDGPEVPCGWILSANGGELNAAIVGHVNHVAPFRFIDTGWHSVAWNYDGTTSKLLVDGALVSSEPRSAATWPWPACSAPAFAAGGGDVDHVAFGGVPSELGEMVGAATLKTDCQ
jgi:hypothetical protein